MEPRRKPDGSLFTWTAYGKASGQPVTVDDVTFNHRDHVLEPVGTEDREEVQPAAPRLTRRPTTKQGKKR